jgi:hypothetical protein
MMNLQVIRLPQMLSFLLSHEVKISPATPSLITGIIQKDPAFSLLVQKTFAEFDPEARVESIVKNLGWKHFRDRLVAMYVFRNLYGKYPQSTDLRLIEDLVSFEQSFQSFAIDSNSRLMLLAVYLRFAEIYSFKRYKETLNLVIEFKQLYELFTIKLSKSPKIDLLLLLVWHLKEFLGDEEIKFSIRAGESFERIAERLSVEQKNIIASNFLSYGASVSEYELFIHDRI